MHYNISANFIACNKKAIAAIKVVVEEKEYLQVVIDEAERNLKQAKEYRTENIDEVYLEVAKVIQFRRAQYLILNEQSSHIDHMLHNGEIQAKDGAYLNSIIGQKLYDLEMNPPNVTLTF